MKRILLFTITLLLLAACTPQEITETLDVQPIGEVVKETPLEKITCIDEDKDNYCTTTDCDDHDATRNPDVEEICEDNIDNNCDGYDTQCEESKITDNDHDGLSNFKETQIGTDKNNHDTDADGLLDSEEISTYGTDPLKYDTDGDSWADGGEVTAQTSPIDILAKPIDTDNDFLADLWEKEYFNSLSYTAKEDPDEDDLTTIEEFNMNTDPYDADTDNDKVWDGYEVNILKTDPKSADTDSDTYTDGREKMDRTDPLDPLSSPMQTTVLNRNADWQRPSHHVQATYL